MILIDFRGDSCGVSLVYHLAKFLRGLEFVCKCLLFSCAHVFTMSWRSFLILEMNKSFCWGHLWSFRVYSRIYSFLFIKNFLGSFIKFSNDSCFLSLWISMYFIKKGWRLWKLIQVNFIPNFILNILWRISILSTLCSISSHRSSCSHFLLRTLNHWLIVDRNIKTLVFHQKWILINTCHIDIVINCSDGHKVVLIIIECLVWWLLIRTKTLGLLDDKFVCCLCWRQGMLDWKNCVSRSSKESLFTEVKTWEH